MIGTMGSMGGEKCGYSFIPLPRLQTVPSPSEAGFTGSSWKGLWCLTMALGVWEFSALAFPTTPTAPLCLTVWILPYPQSSIVIPMALLCLSLCTSPASCQSA